MDILVKIAYGVLIAATTAAIIFIMLMLAAWGAR